MASYDYASTRETWIKRKKQKPFKLPKAEEIFAELNNPMYFTKLGASNGYWHIPVKNSKHSIHHSEDTFVLVCYMGYTVQVNYSKSK